MANNIIKEFTISVSFQLKNPSITNLKIIRSLVDNIKSFDFVHLEYKASESKNFFRVNSISYSLNNREEILDKFNPDSGEVILSKKME
jgi:hypothetical protein